LKLLLLPEGPCFIRRPDQVPELASAECTGRRGEFFGDGSLSREQELLKEFKSYIEPGEWAVSKDVVSSNLARSTPPLRIMEMRLTNWILLGQCPVWSLENNEMKSDCCDCMVTSKAPSRGYAKPLLT
jgi:hypothetical protein